MHLEPGRARAAERKAPRGDWCGHERAYQRRAAPVRGPPHAFAAHTPSSIGVLCMCAAVRETKCATEPATMFSLISRLKSCSSCRPRHRGTRPPARCHAASDSFTHSTKVQLWNNKRRPAKTSAWRRFVFSSATSTTLRFEARGERRIWQELPKVRPLKQSCSLFSLPPTFLMAASRRLWHAHVEFHVSVEEQGEPRLCPISHLHPPSLLAHVALPIHEMGILQRAQLSLVAHASVCRRSRWVALEEQGAEIQAPHPIYGRSAPNGA